MSAKVWLAAMVAGTMLVVVAGARHETASPPPTPRVPPEAPWLTREAAAEIIGPGGALGPLFTGVVLGGSAPLAAVRARIAEFARTHDVAIDLEIVDDEVAAVRFEVMYGGCCGYEGADTLAARIGRPKIGGGCTGDGPSWLDDWAATVEEGVHFRASVRVNRVLVRWEPVATFDELLERADRLLGADRGAVSRKARDRWIEVEPGRHYRLEVPYPLRGPRPYRDELGMDAVVEKGRIAEVSFSIRDPDAEPTKVPAVLRSHWGRPRVHADEPTWTWHRPDRIVQAGFDLDDETTTVTLRVR